MDSFLPVLLRIYSRLLLLDPRRFQEEFAEEMQIVFGDSVSSALQGGILAVITLCLKELGGFPMNVLREFRNEVARKETIMDTNKTLVTETGSGLGRNRQDAILGTLPFLLAGILLMFIHVDLPFHIGYLMITFLAICLPCLLVGMLKGYPCWTFSYFGWSVVMSYWWSGMPRFTFNAFYNPGAMPDLMGILAWIPLLIVLILGMRIGRPKQPFRKLTSAIWRDWTLLSLSIYAFVAFILLIYDENHHPYLFVFMAAGTITICLAVWNFLQSEKSLKRVLSLLAGFVIASVISNISYATWDYATYYGLPPSVPEPWSSQIKETIAMSLFWSVIMFWPAFIGLIRHFTIHRNKPGMAA